MLALRKDANGNPVAFVPRQLDQRTARAYVEAGTMTLREYIERFGPGPHPLEDRVKRIMAQG